ncbi:MAG: DNA polymerase III subunit delta [Hyphomicrobiales bacterium]
MQLKANEVERYIKNKAGFHPVILIYGPDQGLVSERTDAISRLALEGNDDPLSKLTLESDDIANDPGRLIDEANAVALFGGDKVIRVRLNGTRQITKSITAVLEEGSGQSLVLIEGGDLKKSNPVRSLIEKSKTAIAIPCYADDSRSLNMLLQEELQTNNVRISQDAQALLLSLIGQNRQTSRNEIQKLCLYAHDKGEITVDDVELLIGDASASLVDDTIDWVLLGQLQLGLKNFENSLVMGHNSFQTIIVLQRHLTRLQLFSADIANGASVRDVVDRARPPIHFKRKQAVSKQVTIWRGEMVKKALGYVQDAIAESRKKSALSDTIFRALLLKLGDAAKKRANR